MAVARAEPINGCAGSLPEDLDPNARRPASAGVDQRGGPMLEKLADDSRRLGIQSLDINMATSSG